MNCLSFTTLRHKTLSFIFPNHYCLKICWTGKSRLFFYILWFSCDNLAIYSTHINRILSLLYFFNLYTLFTKFVWSHKCNKICYQDSQFRYFAIKPQYQKPPNLILSSTFIFNDTAYLGYDIMLQHIECYYPTCTLFQWRLVNDHIKNVHSKVYNKRQIHYNNSLFIAAVLFLWDRHVFMCHNFFLLCIRR